MQARPSPIGLCVPTTAVSPRPVGRIQRRPCPFQNFSALECRGVTIPLTPFRTLIALKVSFWLRMYASPASV